MIAAAALGLAAVLLLLAFAPSPAQAARPATAKQKTRIAKVLAPTVRKVFPLAQPGFGRCFRLDPKSVKQSTRYPRYFFALLLYRQGSGPCAGDDHSYSFYGFWKFSGRRTQILGGHNQVPFCARRFPVPLAVQRELFPGCQVLPRF